MTPRRHSLGIVSALAFSAMAGACLASPVDDGRELAIEACSACHQVAPQQKRPAPVSEGEEGAHTQAPTFMDISRRCLSSAELKDRITNPHYPMREQLLLPIDVDELANYIRSLSTHPDCVIR